MDIIIKHNLSWYNGGIKVDEIIIKFAKRLGLEESDYNLYTPNYLYLLFENATLKQFNELKKRLNNSKQLVNVDLQINGNNL